VTTDRQHQTGLGHGRRPAQAPETRVGPWPGAQQGFKPLSDRVFASGGALPHQHEWEITRTTTWSGFGARSYRDPRCAGAALDDDQPDVPCYRLGHGWKPATGPGPPPTSPPALKSRDSATLAPPRRKTGRIA
jgi:hypothetical protein